jgi:hypothetical protein
LRVESLRKLISAIRIEMLALAIWRHWNVIAVAEMGPNSEIVSAIDFCNTWQTCMSTMQGAHKHEDYFDEHDVSVKLQSKV